MPCRASDWKLDQPDWTGRLRVTSKGKIAYVKLEDKVSGEALARRGLDGAPEKFLPPVAAPSLLGPSDPLSEAFRWVIFQSGVSMWLQVTMKQGQ